MEDLCKHCGEDAHIPDDKTGEIHVNGLYACYRTERTPEGKKKKIRMETVAEI